MFSAKYSYRIAVFYSVNKYFQRRTMRVVPIPANADNYQYLIVDEKTKSSAVVDPVDVPNILSTSKAESANLCAALVTHHHWDHAGGTGALAKATGPDGLTIYAGDGERVEGVGKVLSDGETFQIGELKVRAIRTPCHTSTHVCYFVEDPLTDERAVFTGDTLFIGGCGRFFEGTAEQMNEALNVRIAQLPDDTQVYCGHEYTVTNLKFAKTVEPNNAAVLTKLAWAEAERSAHRYTIPSTIGAEKTFNPFMRVNQPDVQKKTNENDPLKVMAKLREMKNNFKA